MREWTSGVGGCALKDTFIVGSTELPEPRCYLTGFITEAALSGAGRAQLDETAQGYGYNWRDQPMPLLPISGRFVSTHSGPFEIYCGVEEYASVDDAKNAYALTGIQPAQYTGFQPLPSARGDERQMITGVLGPDPANFQTVRRERWREGRFIVDLNVMGAPDLRQDQFDALASIVDARVRRAASGG